MDSTTESPTTAPQLTVINRVASIPLVSDSLATIHSSLTSNNWTASPYTAVQAISSSVYNVSIPIQSRLSPLIHTADGFANKAVDVVESRYPYPFKTPTGDIYGDLKKSSDHAYGVASQTLNERVVSPTVSIAEGIDRRFTPVVDTFEVVINKLQGTKSETSAAEINMPEPYAPQDKYQYQRAYRLSMGLKDQLYNLTGEQVRQLQQHNILVQRATEAAYSITSSLSTSYHSASTNIAVLSDTMLTELHTLQTSLSSLPMHIQASLHGLTESAYEIGGIIKSERPLQEKVGALKELVEGRIQPVLERARVVVQETLSAVTGGRGSVSQNGAQTNGVVHTETNEKQKNGNLNGTTH